MVTRKQVGNWLQQYKHRINEQFLKKKKKLSWGPARSVLLNMGGNYYLSIYII